MQIKVIVNLDNLGISKPVTVKHYFELKNNFLFKSDQAKV